MWDEARRQRFGELRNRETHSLTRQEQQELQEMLQELEAQEAVYLRPATQRIAEENRRIQEQNIALKGVLEREERLKRHLTDALEVGCVHRANAK